MRVLRYTAWNLLELVDMTAPKPATNEILVRVAACGICGSELETFKNQSPRRLPPLIMGHEFCGEVVEMGSAVNEWAPGDRVVAHAVVHCGSCDCCGRGDEHLCRNRQVFGMHRPGAFAEFVSVPANVAIPWPDGLSAVEACLAEPLANGVHVAELVRGFAPKRCLVIGSGPIGLMCQQALQLCHNAEIVVCDLSRERLAVAARLGALKSIQPQTSDLASSIMEWTSGEGVDCVVDAVGSGLTKQQSLSLLRPGGAAVWIGLHGDEMAINSYEVTLPERAVFGTYSARLADLATAVDWMASARVDVRSWVDASSLEQGVQAFRRMLAAEGDAIKGVLTMGLAEV